MSKQDGLTFGLTGFAAWAAATAYYAAFGATLLESAFWFYALNAFLAAGATTFLFHAAARLRATPRRRQPLCALVFIAPGLVGGALLMVKLTALFPQMEPVSIGRYGAFLLVGYATVLVTAYERKVRAVASPAR